MVPGDCSVSPGASRGGGVVVLSAMGVAVVVAGCGATCVALAPHSDLGATTALGLALCSHGRVFGVGGVLCQCLISRLLAATASGRGDRSWSVGRVTGSKQVTCCKEGKFER